MFNRREKNKTTSHCKKNIFAISLWLTFLFFLITHISFSQNTGEQYDINDPRNPNCPCHKMQKQADEEYALLMNKEKNNNSNLQSNKNKSHVNDELIALNKIDLNEIEWNKPEVQLPQLKLNKTDIAFAGTSKLKKKNYGLRKTKFKLLNKFKAKTKFKNKVDFCFEW